MKVGIGTTNPSEFVSVSGGTGREVAVLTVNGKIKIASDLTVKEAKQALWNIMEVIKNSDLIVSHSSRRLIIESHFDVQNK